MPAPIHHTHHHRYHPHDPGCRTRACDVRVDRWFEEHEEPEGEQVVASWYEDGGETACGFHASLGVANRTLPCGSNVRLCYAGTCITATVQDRGPFIYGRTFDLNAQAKEALGCSDLCDLTWAPA
jgi:rare lipoprotein A (peptidoglycan hydrolase)